MLPDHLGGRGLPVVGHVEVAVRALDHVEGVLDPGELAAGGPVGVPVQAQPSGEQVGVFEEPVHDAGEQGELAIDDGGHGLGDPRIDPGHVVPLHLGEGVRGVDLLPLLGQQADHGEVGDDEAGRRLGEHALAEEPVDEPVVEPEVRRQVVAAELRPREHAGEALVGVQAIGALGQEERDVGVGGGGHAVAHEEAGVGVGQADALVVADLAFDGARPVTDEAAGVGGERGVGGVEGAPPPPRRSGGRARAGGAGPGAGPRGPWPRPGSRPRRSPPDRRGS